MSFVADIAAKCGVPNNHLLVQYLERKTRAADRGSKARLSLGNLYALYVLADDYSNNRTSRFTDLLARMNAMPFGTKLQNHPLDNRLNDEFGRQLRVSGNLLPVQLGPLEGAKSRIISESLLEHQGSDPKKAALFITETVLAYIQKITANQSSELEEILAIESIEELCDFFDSAFAPNADARMFEVVSFVLLAEHYRGETVYIGPSPDRLEQKGLALFRTGRTNANDGGIDFVLQPLGRFFQVTETVDFKKYFLDFEKVNRFPISFVIKINATGAEVKRRIQHDAERSGQYSDSLLATYMQLFDEIFTLQDLGAIAKKISLPSLEQIKTQMALQFQLEYGLLD